MDSRADSRIDSGMDSGVDSEVDSGMDSGADSGVDSGVDSGMDSGTDYVLCCPAMFNQGFFILGNVPFFLHLDLAKNIVSNDGEAVILNKNITKGVFLKGYLESDFKNLQIVKNKEFFMC